MRFALIDLDGAFVAAAREAAARLLPATRNKDLVWYPRTRVETLPRRRTAFISPANSFAYVMDGGIDLQYSQVMFPGITHTIRRRMVEVAPRSRLGRPYIPVGSALITPWPAPAPAPTPDEQTYLVSAPTMYQPQPVPTTRNAYHACTAALHACAQYARRKNADIETLVCPPLCCGWGDMRVEDAAEQVIEAYRDFCQDTVDHAGDSGADVWFGPQPLADQPRYYENSEFFHFDLCDVIQKPTSRYLANRDAACAG